MDRFGIKEKLLDRSDRGENKGLAWTLVLLILLLMSIAVLYFSSKTSSEDTIAPTSRPAARSVRVYSVYYGGGIFSPTNLRIHAGDTVKFQNTSAVSVWVISDPHPLHNILTTLNSGAPTLPQGVFAYTFTDPGIYNYHNELNPNETGLIIVR